MDPKSILRKVKRAKKKKEYSYKYLFYIVESRGIKVSTVRYSIRDKFFHYTWGTASTEDDAKRVLIYWIQKCTSFEQINSMIHQLANNDRTGYTRGFIDRFLDPEGYIQSWKASDKHRDNEPPKRSDWVSKQIEKHGECEFANEVHTFYDLSGIEEELARIKAKQILKRIKREKALKVRSKILKKRVSKREIENLLSILGV